MRKKIWRMSEDHFDEENPQIKYDTAAIEVSFLEGEKARDSFIIESDNDIPFRGVCYSSNPYVKVIKSQFEGTFAEIEYEVSADGFFAGDTIEGTFCIVANGIEQRLPFTIRYTRRYPKSSIGVIDSDDKFIRLCKEHWNEAMQLFFSESFHRFIDDKTTEEKLLYRGFSQGVPSSANLENYLIAANLKEPVIFSIDEETREYHSVSETQKEEIEITRSDWGYIEISASCDADFISLEKNVITADFFMGSTMSLSMYIHADRLHAGKNYARITFESEHSQQELEVCVTGGDYDADYIPPSRIRSKRLVDLTEIYEDYRFENLNSQEWADKSIEILDRLIEDEDDEHIYQLMKAHCAIVSDDKQTALWIIQQERREIEDRNSRNWAYLLYLCTLIEKDEVYVNRLVSEIEMIYRKSEDVFIFWLLLFLREKYINDNKTKLSDIKAVMEEGCTSTFMYIEVDYLYRIEPYIISKLDDFSIRTLHWSIRHGRLTSGIAAQIAYLLENERTFDDEVFALCVAVYDSYPTEEMLTNIAAYLLRNHRFGEDYLRWYGKALERDMNFTGLFEAYILSLPDEYSSQLPQKVLMYFRYQNTLPSEKKSFVYANVITHQNSQIRLYEQYLRHIEDFAFEMLRKRRIDDNLAVIYQHIFIDRGFIDSDVADGMSELLFYDKIFGLPSDITRVIVYQEQLEHPIIASVSRHSCYVPIYSKNYKVFLEDRKGRLRTDVSDYYVEHMMQPQRVYEKLYEKASLHTNYYLYSLSHKSYEEMFDIEYVDDLVEILESDEVALKYKKKLYPHIVEFLLEHGRVERIEKHFRKVDSFNGLDSSTISYITQLHILEDEMTEAYALVNKYNCQSVAGKSLLRMTSAIINEDSDKADDFLVGLAVMLMRRFLSSEETISYMNRFFIGPTPDMVTLWQFASARNIETRALEERILTQMLFSENIDVTSESIYISYLGHHANDMLIAAYRTFFARKYIVTNEKVPESVFSDIMGCFRKDKPTNDSMRIALMRYLCNKKELEKIEFDILDILVGGYMLKGVYFGFYKNMDNRLVIKYHLYDKTFVEYKGKCASHIAIRYTINDKETCVDELAEMYPGFYIKAFVLFFGDTLSYEVIDKSASEEVLFSDNITYTENGGDLPVGRYERLNSIYNAYLYSNDTKLLADMKLYNSLSFATKELFSIL